MPRAVATWLAYLVIIGVASIASRIMVAQLALDDARAVHSSLEMGLTFAIATGLLALLALRAERRQRPGHFHAASFTAAGAILSFLAAFVALIAAGNS